MSRVRKHAFIEAPVQRIWELVSDVERHPEWWPRVVETEAEDPQVGATYRQVMETPRGSEVAEFRVEGMEDFKNLSIRCVNTGMFVRFGLTEVRDGTFVEGEMGMDPIGVSTGSSTWSPAVATSGPGSPRRSRAWSGRPDGKRPKPPSARAALATKDPRAGLVVGDPGFEPGTSSLSEMRSNQLS